MRYRVTATYMYTVPDFVPGLEAWEKSEAYQPGSGGAKPTLIVPAHPESGGGQTKEIEADSVQEALAQMEQRMKDEHQAISIHVESIWFL